MAIQLSHLPSFPVPIKNGVGGLLGRRLYAGLGSAGTHFFYLDVDKQPLCWKPAPSFPGVARNDAVCASNGRELYIFSGAGKLNPEDPLTVLMDGYVFSLETETWQKIDTRLPVGLLGASADFVDENNLLFFGGYCKEVFDRLFAELASCKGATEKQRTLEAFMSQPIDRYGWNQDIWQFDIANPNWHLYGDNPSSATCGASLVKHNQLFVLIEGEIKPGLRSLKTTGYLFQEGQKLSTLALPRIVDQYDGHEGIAGAYSGLINNTITLVGGAYFIGSQSNFAQGQNYSHQGLTKHYSESIWQLDSEDGWKEAAKMSEGCAYGVSITVDDSLIVIGGELASGCTSDRCLVISDTSRESLVC